MAASAPLHRSSNESPGPPFRGFTRDTLYTPVPNALFGPLLEQVQDLAELKVTLRALWLLDRKKGAAGPLTLNEFLSDRTLLRGLAVDGIDAEQEVRRGLRLAVGRGTLLHHQQDDGTQVFLLNTEAGKKTLARLKSGGGGPDGAVDSPGPPEEAPTDARPNIFALYEDNIGAISPILAEELKEAEERYPWPWIREAFQVSAAENRRSWRYIAGILRRWTAEGKDEGRHGGIFDGKPGRHTPENQREKHLRDYERRWGRSAGPGAGGAGDGR